jgi:hypothetical protein
MVTNVRTYETGTVVSDRGIADPGYAESGHPLHPGHMHVHWGSVFAGLFVALSVMALLSAFGAAVGATAYDPGDDPRRFGIGTGIWALISALVSFIIGGFVAARTSGHTDRQNGLFHGFMVWAVAIPLLAFLVGSGLTRLTSGAIRADMSPNPARVDLRDTTAQDAKKAAMAAAWGALASLLLGMGAASLGGHLGARGLPRLEDLKPHAHTPGTTTA